MTNKLPSITEAATKLGFSIERIPIDPARPAHAPSQWQGAILRDAAGNVVFKGKLRNAWGFLGRAGFEGVSDVTKEMNVRKPEDEGW